MNQSVTRREDEWSQPGKAIWPWFQDMLTTRLNKRFNIIILVCGMAGIGKSYASMVMCQEMDRTFNINRICFEPQEVFKIVDKMKKKQWLIIDEPALSGVLSKRSWMQDAQQSLVDLIETFRFKNLGLCFNTISSQLLDKTIRELLCHFMIVMRERGYGKVYAIEPSQFRSQVRTPFLGDAYFELPSNQLIKEYETKRASFIKTRYYQSLNEMQMKEATQLTLSDILEQAKAHIKELRNNKGDIDIANIQMILSVGRERAYTVKRKLIELGL